MSQIYRSTSAGPPPPDVPTDFETQDGTATPIANILLVTADDTTEDDVDGIRTVGGGQGNPATALNEVRVELTNRVQGQVTTTDATPTNIITFSLPADGTYTFDVSAAAYNTDADIGAGYHLFGTIRRTGADTFLVGSPDKIVNEEGAMSASDFNMVAGGVADTNVYFEVTGIAANVEWCSYGYYCLIAQA